MPKSKSPFFQPSYTVPLQTLLVIAAAVTLVSCAKTAGNAGSVSGSAAEMIKPAAPPAGFARADDSDPELIAAKVEAQAKLPEFAAAFAKRDPEQKFAIKAPFREGPNEEHKWVIVDKVKKDEMDGHIERPSQTIKHLKVGQVITVNDYNIEDWAYTDKKGQQHGGFSVAVLRKREGAGVK